MRFKVIGHLEGEIALITQETFVFSLHFHGLFFVQLLLFLINQATKLGITECHTAKVNHKEELF